MTQEGFYIDEKSLKALRINIRVFRADVLREAHDGLREFGMQIVAKAKDILHANGNIASGLLRNSGRTVEQPDGTIDAGFYATYAYWVEYGRKAGGMPPVDVIFQWVKRKHRISKYNALRAASRMTGKSQDELARQEAWAIATWIKRHGTKAHPFLKPAYEQYRWNINKFMTGVIERTVSKFKPKK